MLVVDDDPMNVKLIVEALTLEQYVVESASSGREALDKIESWGPELVLLDYQMPGLSGLETLKVLRSRQNYVAAIFISANTEQELVVDCLGAGADDYIRKPFRFTELLARVKVRFRIKDLNDELQKANLRLKELSETTILPVCSTCARCTTASISSSGAPSDTIVMSPASCSTSITSRK